MSRILRAVAIVALIALSSGCYHHHLRANGDRVNSTYFRKTLNSSNGDKRNEFIVPPPDSGAQGAAGLRSSADCKDNGLYEVGITSYWKYAAGTVFTFGRWSRVKVEWLCAKEPPVIGPRGLGSQPPVAPDPRAGSPAGVERKPRHVNTNRDDFTKRTLHAFFWGALQQNLLPPAPPATSTPANCKSMRQVKVPMNYGYALITVATVGIWSPLRVAWQCAEDPNGGSKPPALASFGAIPPVSPGLLRRLPGATAGPYIPSSKEENHVPR
jgi:hypothetical protein